MFVWLPVSIAWRYGYDTVLIHRYIGDGALYVEVIRTWCLTAKEKMASTVTPTRYDKSKCFELMFDLEVIKMILTECEDCGVNTVGDNFQSWHEFA